MAKLQGAFGPVRFPIYPPSGCEDRQTATQPQEAPALSHVHGFHAAARPPAVFLAERRAAVASGKLVAVLDLDTGEQDFVRGHSDAVTCLAFSSEYALGASGQVRQDEARCAEVLVWSTETLQCCATIIYHQADIEAVAFVQGGDVLVTIAADRDHTLALWAVMQNKTLRMRRHEKKPLAVCSAYKSGTVNGMLAAPEEENLPPRFATFGAAHVKFWQFDKLGIAPTNRRGAFGPEGAPRNVTAVAWAASDRLVVGGSAGEVFFFQGTRAIRRVQLQSSCVALLLPLRDALLVTYSNGVCSLLRSERAVDIDLATLPGTPDTRMQAPIVGGAAWRQNSLLLASLTHLVHLDLAGGFQQPSSCNVILAQPSKPLTSVCVHPAEPRMFAGALDGGVRCYRTDVHRHVPERSFKVSSGVTCLAISHCVPGSSAWLAVGMEDSTLAVLGEVSQHYHYRRKLTAAPTKLTCAAFSTFDPTGSHPLWLAVGTEDGCIHTFRFKDPMCRDAAHTGAETVTKVATLRGHAAPLRDVSFSQSLSHVILLSVDAAGQGLSFDVKMGRRLPSVALIRDATFSPWTSPLGWHVLGCWVPQRSPPKSAAVLPPRRFCEITGRHAIAVSDSEVPAIELFPFPCPTPPHSSPLRLEGPAHPIVALLHGGPSDRLLAVSDTMLFVWAWQSEPANLARPAHMHQELGEAHERLSPERPSPLKAIQNRGGVVFETPEGRKHAMALEDGATPSPLPRRHPVAEPGARHAKDDHFHSPPKLPFSGADGRVPMGWDAESPGPSKQPLKEAPHDEQRWRSETGVDSPIGEVSGRDVVRDGRRWGEAPLNEARPARFPDVDPLPNDAPWEQRQREHERIDGHHAPAGWTIAEDPRAIDQRPHRYRRSPDDIAPKIGAHESNTFDRVVSSTQRIRDDTAARARCIHERMDMDRVGQILSGQDDREIDARHERRPVGCVAPAGLACESPAGRFLYRARDTETRYEVEAQLPGGKLLRVVRNPFKRTLIFEGELISHWTVASTAAATQEAERLRCDPLVVRIPPGFDLAGPPAHVERDFESGRCFVAFHRRTFGGGSVRPAWEEEQEL